MFVDGEGGGELAWNHRILGLLLSNDGRGEAPRRDNLVTFSGITVKMHL